MNANEINEHLSKGGVVQVTTYTRSTIYTAKHAGWFFNRDGSLYVKHGKRSNQLLIGERMLVGLRFGHLK